MLYCLTEPRLCVYFVSDLLFLQIILNCFLKSICCQESAVLALFSILLKEDYQKHTG